MKGWVIPERIKYKKIKILAVLNNVFNKFWCIWTILPDP